MSTAINNCLVWISILLRFDKLLHLFTYFATPIEIWGIAQDFCTSCLSHAEVAITDVLKGQFWTVLGIRGRNIVAFQTCSAHQKMISIGSFLTVREAFVWFMQGCILGRARMRVTLTVLLSCYLASTRGRVSECFISDRTYSFTR